MASYDRKEWFRAPTYYEGKNLIINHILQHNSIYYAYSTPYSYERHQDLISNSQLSNYCQVEVLCETVNSHALSLLRIGKSDKNKRKCWIIARQHSGETMAEWFCEGLIKRLLYSQDKIVELLLSKAEFYIVPNMNPDGSILGNQRANGAGIDLNRQWQSPDKMNAPEVYFVKEKIQEIGVDFFFDVHGDETELHAFTISNSQNPNCSVRVKKLENIFKTQYNVFNLDFHTTHGYEPDSSTLAQFSATASFTLGTQYDCLAFTLEMPFIDNENRPAVVKNLKLF